MAASEAELLMRLCMTPRRAAERRSKRRMSEHTDVRVRRGRRSASTKGNRADTTSARSSCPAHGFGHFCR